MFLWTGQLSCLCSLTKLSKSFHISVLKRVDVRDALAFVSDLSEQLWALETKKRKNNFDVFEDVEHIVFRYWEASYQSLKVYEEYPLWSFAGPVIMPLIEEIVITYGYKAPTIPVIMLAKLKARSHIAAHKDKGRRFELTHKIHVPLITNQEVKFYVEKEPYHLEGGYAYEVNNTALHSVENNSSSDRIHLIFECFPNE